MSAPSRTTRGRRSLPGNRESAALVVSAVVTGLTLAVSFALLAVEFEAFWVTYVVGFGVVLPVALGGVTHLWAESDDGDGAGDDRRATGDIRTPVEELRMQYARGELTEEEFDRRVARLTDDE